MHVQAFTNAFVSLHCCFLALAPLEGPVCFTVGCNTYYVALSQITSCPRSGAGDVSTEQLH